MKFSKWSGFSGFCEKYASDFLALNYSQSIKNSYVLQKDSLKGIDFVLTDEQTHIIFSVFLKVLVSCMSSNIRSPHYMKNPL